MVTGLTSTRYFGPLCYKHPEAEGLRSMSNEQCIYCRREREKARRQSEAHRIKEKARNAERMRNYRAEGRFVGNLRSHTARFQPAWADLGKIRNIYKEAKRLGLTVDHGIPLRGKQVCGLHVHNNLQLLPASANFSKGNKFPIKEQ